MSSSILTVGILCVNLSCKHVLVLQLEENKGYTGVARTASDGPTVMACFVVVHHIIPRFQKHICQKIVTRSSAVLESD